MGYYYYLLGETIHHELEGISITNMLMLFFVVAVFVFVPGIILHYRKGTSYKRIFKFYLIIAYFIVILSITVLRRPIGSRDGFSLDIALGFGLKGHRISYKGSTISILNILLFVPWGVFVYNFLYDICNKKRVLYTTISGFFTSAVIEITQLISSTGNFELTDLVTNTFGTFVGSLIVVTIIRHKNAKLKS